MYVMVYIWNVCMIFSLYVVVRICLPDFSVC
jgi:hypothetical protein